MKLSLPINPRYGVPAISWSDVKSIESNPRVWYGQTLGLLPRRHTPSLAYGTMVHNYIQRRDFTELGINPIPHGDDPERTVVTEVMFKHARRTYRFQIVGTPDDADRETIYEYKTGLKLWTRRQVETHDQIYTYALLRYKETGILPTRAVLVSLETFNDDHAGICLTGKSRSIEVPITLADTLKVQARFIAAYKKAIDVMQRIRPEDYV